MNTNEQTYAAWIGHEVDDQAGKKVGRVAQIYVDERSGQPEWLAVDTGMFSSKVSFVPISDVRADGDRLVVGYEKDFVKDAPRVEQNADGFLTTDEEAELFRYYGRDYGASGQVTGQGQQYETGRGAETGGPGHDVSGPNTDEAMTRSEEELQVGTQQREAGRVRLRKYVTTEQVTQTVPVSHEEVRLEREPITEGNYGAATDGPDISEEEHEVTLYEERPVVQKDVVPRERVRLEKDVVTDEHTVNEELRKEVIDTDDGGKRD